MVKIIFTSRYFRNPKGSNLGKLVKYMGTREGVEKLPDGEDHSPATVRQQRLINQITKTFPETKNYLEYEDYQTEQSKYFATEFIDAVIERKRQKTTCGMDAVAGNDRGTVMHRRFVEENIL